MKSIEQILIEEYGVGLKKGLTYDDYDDMMKSDQEISSSIPDAHSSKMNFIEQMQQKYSDIKEFHDFWLKEEERLKKQYPAIHKGG